MTPSTSAWKGKTIRFLAAQTISLLGSSLVQYAIIWYITLTTSSGAMMTLSTVCGFAPQILISLFAGVWIDRYPRRRIIVLADGMIAAATLALAILFLTGLGSLWMLFAALLVRSAGTGVQTPAVNALIPQIVPREQLMRVNGVQSTLSSITMLLSPAISGAILSAASIEAIFLIDVVTAAIGIAITLTVDVPFQPADRAESPLRQIGRGFGYLRGHLFVRRLLLSQVAVLILISPSAFLTPLMVSRTFGAEVWYLTASEMTFSLGMVVGGLLIAAWGGFKSRIRTTLAAGLLYGALMIGLGAAPVFWAYLVCNLLIGITSPCYNAPITVLIQERVAPEMHGRVFSLMQIASSCALPLGMVFFGPLADLAPVQAILIGCGAAVMVLIGALAVSRRLEV
ncbi:MAG: MFS transporter [Christensenellales bacterium]|jgi:DHA3 family macrolide efflux protein-like MFS transporter